VSAERYGLYVAAVCRPIATLLIFLTNGFALPGSFTCLVISILDSTGNKEIGPMERDMIVTTNDFDSARETAMFDRFAKRMESWVGHPIAFGAALLAVVLWAGSGPLFGFSNAWQLVINTATTIVTFLMVFLIQHTTNRASAAIQLKLDELIRAQEGAHNAVLAAEELTLEEIEQLRTHYERLAQLARARLKQGIKDTGSPEVSML